MSKKFEKRHEITYTVVNYVLSTLNHLSMDDVENILNVLETLKNKGKSWQQGHMSLLSDALEESFIFLEAEGCKKFKANRVLSHVSELPHLAAWISYLYEGGCRHFE